MSKYNKPLGPIEGDPDDYEKLINPDFQPLAGKKKSVPRMRLNSATNVGYCRPPVAPQFKSGRSGNPNGRPKGRQNIGTMMEKIFTDKITIREGGKCRKVTRLEAMLLKTLENALRGDHKAMQAMVATAKALGLMDSRIDKVEVDTLAAKQKVACG